MSIDLSLLDDETKNDIACDWYFLNLQLNSYWGSYAGDLSNEVLESGLKLKAILESGNFSEREPMNVYVDSDTFFDVWLDEDNQIQTKDLYTEDM